MSDAPAPPKRKWIGRLVFVALILAVGPVGRRAVEWIESKRPLSESEREEERQAAARRAAKLTDCERRAAELDAADRKSCRATKAIDELLKDPKYNRR